MTTAEVIRQCREALHTAGYHWKTHADAAEVCFDALRAIDEWEAGGDTAAAWQALAEERGEALADIGEPIEDGMECAYCNWDEDDGCESHCPRFKAEAACWTNTPADALARRDERQMALGAAEWIEGNIDRTLSMGPHCIVTIRVPVFGLDAQEFMRREAAALRKKAEGK